MHGTHIYTPFIFKGVLCNGQKNRLECPKIIFCCINHVTKSVNITASANAAAILTLTNHMAIRCLPVTCPFKETEFVLFPVIPDDSPEMSRLYSLEKKKRGK